MRIGPPRHASRAPTATALLLATALLAAGCLGLGPRAQEGQTVSVRLVEATAGGVALDPMDGAPFTFVLGSGGSGIGPAFEAAVAGLAEGAIGQADVPVALAPMQQVRPREELKFRAPENTTFEVGDEGDFGRPGSERPARVVAVAPTANGTEVTVRFDEEPEPERSAVPGLVTWTTVNETHVVRHLRIDQLGAFRVSNRPDLPAGTGRILGAVAGFVVLSHGTASYDRLPPGTVHLRFQLEDLHSADPGAGGGSRPQVDPDLAAGAPRRQPAAPSAAPTPAVHH